MEVGSKVVCYVNVYGFAIVLSSSTAAAFEKSVFVLVELKD